MNKAACCRSVSSSSIDMPSERDGELIIFSAGNIQRESDEVNWVVGEGEETLVVVMIAEFVCAVVIFDSLFVSDMVVVVAEESVTAPECCNSLEETLLVCSSPYSLSESLVLSLMSMVDAVLL